MTREEAASISVDIIASLFNGGAYLDDLFESLESQTHGTWRLWLRDDASDDDTLVQARAFAARNARATVLETGGVRLCPAASFGWLLERIAPETAYVMCADQDDVWLPTKIARTLAAMLEAEAHAPGPLLVHTDLTVVDEHMRVIDPSFWRFSGVDPEPVTLRRLIVQNVATGATLMLNRSLRELVGPLPPGAVFHDWWYACVASAFGRLVAIRESTILYRQHGTNVVGAARDRRTPWYKVPALARSALEQTAHLRSEIGRTARQAAALLERFGPRLSEADRRFLRAYARLPERGMVRRKLDVARLHLRREHGFWRNLGVLLRA